MFIRYPFFDRGVPLTVLSFIWMIVFINLMLSILFPASTKSSQLNISNKKTNALSKSLKLYHCYFTELTRAPASAAAARWNLGLSFSSVS